jgi:zinc protease
VGHADSYPLHVAEAVLSTGKTSRFYSRLVDGDQSVTAVKASYNAHIDPSLFYIQAELKPGFGLASVEQAIHEEIDRLKREIISKEELDRAKRQIESELVLTTEEILQQAILLGQYETIAFRESIPEDSRGYKYLGTFLTRIREVTAEDVSRVATDYLVEDNRTVGFLTDISHGTGSGGSIPTVDGPAVVDHADQRTGQPLWGMSPRMPFRTGSSDKGDPTHLFTSGCEAKRIRSARSRSLNETAATISSSALNLEVERVQLANGLILLLSENHSSPGVAIDVVTQVGSRAESDEQAGLASLVGEVLDEGTKTRTSEEIAKSIESVGGKLRAYGDYESSGIKASFLSEDIWLGMEIVADLLMNAVFPDERVTQFMERRIAQIKSRLDVPRVLTSDVFNEIVFKGHPQHRPSIGYESTVSSLNRQSLLDFYRRYWVPNNTLFAVVGDFNRAALKARITELLGSWEPAPDFRPIDIRLPHRQEEPIAKYVNAAKEQVNILVGHVGIERKNPDFYALLVMDTILGSSPGFTSRIPRVLRDEQGLAYSTFSNITASAGVDPGRFVAYIGTSPENLDRAISGLRREIERIVREPVTVEELEISKDYLTGSFVFDFQTNSQIAEFLIDAEVYDLGFDYLREYPKLIRSITLDDVTRVARKYIDPENLTTVVVGPVDEQGNLVDRH